MPNFFEGILFTPFFNFPPHAVLDVVVDDEVQLLVHKAIILGEDSSD